MVEKPEDVAAVFREFEEIIGAKRKIPFRWHTIKGKFFKNLRREKSWQNNLKRKFFKNLRREKSWQNN